MIFKINCTFHLFNRLLYLILILKNENLFTSEFSKLFQHSFNFTIQSHGQYVHVTLNLKKMSYGKYMIFLLLEENYNLSTIGQTINVYFSISKLAKTVDAIPKAEKFR